MTSKKLPNIDLIRTGLGHYAAIKPVQKWLDTGHPLLHRVLGSEEYGIAYGKQYEISGWESQGKTILLLLLAKYAQDDGALPVLMMLENRFDRKWARRLGLDTKNIVLIQPYLKGKAQPKGWDKWKPQKKKAWLRKNEPEDLSSIEELSLEMITVVKKARRDWDKIFVGVDSIAAMITNKEADTDETDNNMNVTTELSRFLSRTLKKWAIRAEIQNAMFVYTNQLRVKPAVQFGNPEYTVAGNTVKYYASARAKIYRAEGGKIRGSDGRVKGIKGYIQNFKNKVGGGSVEDAKIAFKFYFDRPPKFIEAKELKEK